MFFYSDKYHLEWLGHVFPVEKYKLTHERIIATGGVGPELITEPRPATREEMERVHTPAYLDELERLAAKGVGANTEFEAPLTREVLDAVILAAGGTAEACRYALSHGGAAMNLSGGFHHAYPDHGEGFCFINDVTVAAAAVLAEDLAGRVMVVDCDVHQGNGTAKTFSDEERVFTLDIHQENNYPSPKEKANVNIGLPDATGDDHYLELLGAALENHAVAFAPDLIIYLAGGDPYVNDTLGGLALTKKGFVRRDELVIETARDIGAALAVVLAGGYPENMYDVVDIHFQTAQLLVERCF